MRGRQREKGHTWNRREKRVAILGKGTEGRLRYTRESEEGKRGHGNEWGKEVKKGRKEVGQRLKKTLRGESVYEGKWGEENEL